MYLFASLHIISNRTNPHVIRVFAGAEQLVRVGLRLSSGVHHSCDSYKRRGVTPNTHRLLVQRKLMAPLEHEQEAPPAKPTTTCTFCGLEFPTRSALFRHLRLPAENCPAPRQDLGEKIVLIIGYDCCGAGGVSGGDSASQVVLGVMGAGTEDTHRRRTGFSQASFIGSRRCPLLAQEAGVSAT